MRARGRWHRRRRHPHRRLRRRPGTRRGRSSLPSTRRRRSRSQCLRSRRARCRRTRRPHRPALDPGRRPRGTRSPTRRCPRHRPGRPFRVVGPSRRAVASARAVPAEIPGEQRAQVDRASGVHGGRAQGRASAVAARRAAHGARSRDRVLLQGEGEVLRGDLRVGARVAAAAAGTAVGRLGAAAVSTVRVNDDTGRALSEREGLRERARRTSAVPARAGEERAAASTADGGLREAHLTRHRRSFDRRGVDERDAGARARVGRDRVAAAPALGVCARAEVGSVGRARVRSHRLRQRRRSAAGCGGGPVRAVRAGSAHRAGRGRDLVGVCDTARVGDRRAAVTVLPVALTRERLGEDRDAATALVHTDQGRLRVPTRAAAATVAAPRPPSPPIAV